MLNNTLIEERVDPRIIRTRNLLQQAFIQIVSEKGFHAVSVQDIAERAGVNRTTFYLHFPDKYALLDYTFGQLFRQEIDKRMTNVYRFSAEHLRLLIVTVFEFVFNITSHCLVHEPQFETLIESQVKKQLQAYLRTWIENTDIRVDLETAATATSWAIYGLAQQWSHEKKRMPVEAFADRVLPLIAANLGLAQPA